MEIAMGAIGPLLPKLRELLHSELTMEKQVRKGIESLVTELKLMHAVLSKVSKVPADQLDEGVKIWAGNVKELSYQMEDIVDAFMVRVGDGGESTNPKNRVKKILKKVKRLFKNGKDLHRISDALEEVVLQAKQLAELRQRYEQEMRDTSANTSVDPRMMALYTDVTELVGIEETRDKLINMLTEGDDWSKHPLKTISIVGFGGLGKTTLAKAAYDKIKVQFDCGAFVSVSQNPEMKKVLKDILYGLDKVKYENIHNAARDEKYLIDDIIEFLNDKRYLIVIDDIWNEKAWELIKCAFSKKSTGSRLITTTRNASVSEACCSSEDDIYRMEPLSNDVSRTLFCKRIFSQEEGCPQELLKVSEEILKKCGGVPLAIITIASLLANKGHIKAKDEWYALLSSIGHGLTKDRSLEQMKKILLFSYYDLPSYLKPCLLYLSIFPEDHEIRRDRLIWRWISEGFVYSENQDIRLYELGDSYFNELVNRSMIQPIGIDNEKKVKACRVHDMVLDLICSLASEENFGTILDGIGRKMPNSEIKVRRLSIQNSKIDVETTRMEHIRSVTIFTSDVVGKVLDISSFQVLHVLDLEGCKNVSDVGYVGNLLHLRYLGLKGTHVKDLPKEIGKLKFLLTLDLRGSKIEVLPSSVVQLRRLMCLYVGCNMKLPSGIGNLTSLEVLDNLGLYDVDLDFVKELGHLTKLRVLRLDCNGFDESLSKALEESISNIYKLESLDVYVFHGLINWPSEDWVPPPQLRRLAFPSTQSWFKTLPLWINPSSLPLLSYLEITLFEVRSEVIQLLGTLPALVYLQIWNYSLYRKGHEVEAPVLSSGAALFPCATECRFYSICAMPSMFPRGAAPRLKRLVFSFAAKWISRENLDLGMRHLPSLQRVRVDFIEEGASRQEVAEAEDALRAAAEDHPNRPVLEIGLW
ncbi:Disease resistance RPP13-like protein 4 [Triticum urartu]|uniref:CNL-C n=1 Tax=Triticum urartu TaxID=4572 RepID=M7YFA9_TRIUA|nr:disease resistance protein RGA5-like [Triticum urartu]XP_048566034.1 disease resistance protein RGA5-like [Triticum urartu]AGQ42597.1 CNL-C [Triticum urartu]EMS45832.1 Disease resistance RPP13-like protein 4 [Triticum urartu]